MGAAAVAAVMVAGACGPSTGTETLTVLAAASLSESFTELGRRFEADHPGVRVAFNFGASSGLARQLAEGAPGDVLATADEATMGRAVEAGAVRGPVVFARNRLAIVTRPGNPEGIADLADLARPGLVVVLCAPEVPCGRLAAKAIARAGVEARAASLEENVKAVVAKVGLGEADAGIAYVTDVLAAGDRVSGVDIPAAGNVSTPYPMAVAAAGDPGRAQAWVDFVVGPAGQAVLARHGFAAAVR